MPPASSSLTSSSSSSPQAPSWLSARRWSLRRLGLLIVVVLTPLLVGSGLMWHFFDATLLDITPFWNDELFHWHQSLTFSRVGFNGGYYTLDEQIPVADWSHFYAWGAFPYVIYGTIARVVGWGLASLAVVNLVLFMAATTFFIFALRLTTEQLLWLAALLATFVPLLTYLPSSMLQLLHLAIATVLALGAALALRGSLTGWRRMALLAFALLAGLLRPTWAVFVLPLWILSLEERTLPKILRAVVLSIPLIGLAAYGYSISAAPYPFFRTEIMANLSQPDELLGGFLLYLQENISHLTGGIPMIWGQRVQIVGLAMLMSLWGIWQYRRHPHDMRWRWELALHLFNLLAFYAATIVLHEARGGHDYRVMAPHLWVSLLLLLALRRRMLLAVMIASSVALLPSAMDNYQQKAPNFDANIVPAQRPRWNPIIDAHVQYQADAPSAWCNTVAVSAYYLFPGQGQPGLVLAFEGGIGMSWLFDWQGSNRFDVPDAIQSRYVMLTDDDAQRYRNRFDGVPLAEVQNGTLYENRAVQCDSSS